MLGWLFLLGRILFLAYERILVKKLGSGVSPLVAGFFFFFVGALFMLPFIFLFELPSLLLTDLSFFPYALLSGSLLCIADFFYIYALSKERVSLIVPLYNFNLLFLLAFSVLFVHDSFSFSKLLGVIIVIIATFLLQRSSFPSFSEALKSKPVLAILLSGLLFALLRSVDALSFKTLSPPPILYAVIMYLVASAGYLLILVIQNQLHNLQKFVSHRPILCLQSGFVNGFSYLFLLFAIGEIQVSIAEPIAMLSLPLSVFLAQRELKESPNWPPILLMFAGVLLMFL
ncbi:EamA family transporter [Candidatus Micrarchaeota archaeon]|nr:EamA family transporter [Candidatus Micrarchaeota archaeon]